MQITEDILDIHVDSFDGTLRDFFKELLCQLWNQAEGFSGKRPLGDSNWQNQVYKALIKNGIIGGQISALGEAECDNMAIADRLITELIVEHM